SNTNCRASSTFLIQPLTLYFFLTTFRYVVFSDSIFRHFKRNRLKNSGTNDFASFSAVRMVRSEFGSLVLRCLSLRVQTVSNPKLASFNFTNLATNEARRSYFKTNLIFHYQIIIVMFYNMYQISIPHLTHLPCPGNHSYIIYKP